MIRRELRGRAELSAEALSQSEALGRSVDWGCEPPFDWSAAEWLVLAWDGDRLLSQVGILQRAIRVGGREIRVAGIGSVCTLPEAEGRGLASENMQRAAEFMRVDLGVPFALLLCLPDRVPFYRRLGWDAAPGPLRFERPEDAEQPFGAMVLSLTGEPWPEGEIDLCGNPW
jgi:GNAT superfamily N-acetyltransferase